MATDFSETAEDLGANLVGFTSYTPNVSRTSYDNSWTSEVFGLL
jgi:hypothetical protein